LHEPLIEATESLPRLKPDAEAGPVDRFIRPH
jgi:hypothetical protein